MHQFEIMVSIKRIPRRRILNTNIQQVHIRKNEQNSNDSPRDNIDWETKETIGEKRFANQNSSATTIPVFNSAKKTGVRMFPFIVKGTTFKFISMNLEKCSHMIGG